MGGAGKRRSGQTPASEGCSGAACPPIPHASSLWGEIAGTARSVNRPSPPMSLKCHFGVINIIAASGVRAASGRTSAADCPPARCQCHARLTLTAASCKSERAMGRVPTEALSHRLLSSSHSVIPVVGGRAGWCVLSQKKEAAGTLRLMRAKGGACRLGGCAGGWKAHDRGHVRGRERRSRITDDNQAVCRCKLAGALPLYWPFELWPFAMFF